MPEHDAIVVGAGASGCWAAKELAEAGLSVLLLEAGRAPTRAERPVPPPPEARLRSRVAALVGGQRVQMRCPAFNARTRGFFVSDRSNPYATLSDRPFNWFRGRQVGGRLPLWARVSPRLTDRELEAGWPLSETDLAPSYDRVEAFHEVERPALNAGEERFRDAVLGAFPGLSVEPPPLLRADPDPVPAPLRAALATGLVTLRPGAVVRRVSVDAGTGRARGVELVDADARADEEARARVVVLCASTIETLRIMLNSASPAHPHGLGGSSGRLGSGLMDHVLSGIGGPIGAKDDRRQTTDDREDLAPYDLGRVVGFRVGPVRGTGFTRSYAIQGAVGRESDAWYLLAHGEMLARDANRVTLHPRRTDAWGIPIAHLACAPGAEERAMAGDQLRVMHELAGAAGLEVRTPPSGRSFDALAFRLWRRRLVGPAGAFLPGSAAHEIGGAAMGTDPARSVVDPHGRCWDAGNVYVADGACFPAGCWQNVTLTIMALAVRASGHIVAEARAGRL